MGLIRKTLSISTLGLVSWRSKKERIRRAEKALADAEADLEREHQAREAADGRLSEALKRAKKAELDAIQEAEAAGKERRRRKRHDKAAAAATMKAARKPKSRRAKRKAEKARGRRTERLKKDADEITRRARQRIEEAEKALGPRLETASVKAKSAGADAVERTHAMAEKVRERAEELAKERR
ncbi:hypothetical protein [Actinomarinicola tropica]|uniref:Uncharacterized protein n=1 Tax=Actinomarinicola tropica TaxID=2789776 RepID=A0A5Q2RA68_9ACTN|nr:hypothetical protein [Actinomarinicola tropica]QGG93769.1 hypothetical protein GH723_00825 [Actinomarinicola tropica]